LKTSSMSFFLILLFISFLLLSRGLDRRCLFELGRESCQTPYPNTVKALTVLELLVFRTV
jgi:hypothetical protein